MFVLFCLCFDAMFYMRVSSVGGGYVVAVVVLFLYVCYCVWLLLFVACLTLFVFSARSVLACCVLNIVSFCHLCVRYGLCLLVCSWRASGFVVVPCFCACLCLFCLCACCLWVALLVFAGVLCCDLLFVVMCVCVCCVCPAMCVLWCCFLHVFVCLLWGVLFMLLRSLCFFVVLVRLCFCV